MYSLTNDPDSMKSKRGDAQRDDSRMVSEHDHGSRQTRDTPMRAANLRPEQSEFRVAGHEIGGTGQKQQPIDVAEQMKDEPTHHSRQQRQQQQTTPSSMGGNRKHTAAVKHSQPKTDEETLTESPIYFGLSSSLFKSKQPELQRESNQGTIGDQSSATHAASRHARKGSKQHQNIVKSSSAPKRTDTSEMSPGSMFNESQHEAPIGLQESQALPARSSDVSGIPRDSKRSNIPRQRSGKARVYSRRKANRPKQRHVDASTPEMNLGALFPEDIDSRPSQEQQSDSLSRLPEQRSLGHQEGKTNKDQEGSSSQRQPDSAHPQSQGYSRSSADDFQGYVFQSPKLDHEPGLQTDNLSQSHRPVGSVSSDLPAGEHRGPTDSGPSTYSQPQQARLGSPPHSQLQSIQQQQQPTQSGPSLSAEPVSAAVAARPATKKWHGFEIRDKPKPPKAKKSQGFFSFDYGYKERKKAFQEACSQAAGNQVPSSSRLPSQMPSHQQNASPHQVLGRPHEEPTRTSTIPEKEPIDAAGVGESSHSVITSTASAKGHISPYMTSAKTPEMEHDEASAARTRVHDTHDHILAGNLAHRQIHSNAAMLKSPILDPSLFPEEQPTYPRGDSPVHENPAHPDSMMDVMEIPYHHRSTHHRHAHGAATTLKHSAHGSLPPMAAASPMHLPHRNIGQTDTIVGRDEHDSETGPFGLPAAFFVHTSESSNYKGIHGGASSDVHVPKRVAVSTAPFAPLHFSSTGSDHPAGTGTNRHERRHSHTAALFRPNKVDPLIFPEEDPSYLREDDNEMHENPTRPSHVLKNTREIQLSAAERHPHHDLHRTTAGGQSAGSGANRRERRHSHTAALFQPNKVDPLIFPEEDPSYPREDNNEMHENPAQPSHVLSNTYEVQLSMAKRHPHHDLHRTTAAGQSAHTGHHHKHHHSHSAALFQPNKVNPLIFPEEDPSYPREDNNEMHENPAQPSHVLSNTYEVQLSMAKRHPHHDLHRTTAAGQSAHTGHHHKHHHSHSAALFQPNKVNPLIFPEEDPSYPREDNNEMHENPAQPSHVLSNTREIQLSTAKRHPHHDLHRTTATGQSAHTGHHHKRHHSHAAALFQPNKVNPLIFPEEDPSYPREDDNEMHKNPAQPPHVLKNTREIQMSAAKRHPHHDLHHTTAGGRSTGVHQHKRHHSHATALFQPNKLNPLIFPEEDPSYPREDDNEIHKNPAQPPHVLKNTREIQMSAAKRHPHHDLHHTTAGGRSTGVHQHKRHHSHATALFQPNKLNPLIFPEEDPSYPREDDNEMHENPAQPPHVLKNTSEIQLSAVERHPHHDLHTTAVYVHQGETYYGLHGSRWKEPSHTRNNTSTSSVRQSDFPLETRRRGDAYYGRDDFPDQNQHLSISAPSFLASTAAAGAVGASGTHGSAKKSLEFNDDHHRSIPTSSSSGQDLDDPLHHKRGQTGIHKDIPASNILSARKWEAVSVLPPSSETMDPSKVRKGTHGDAHQMSSWDHGQDNEPLLTTTTRKSASTAMPISSTPTASVSSPMMTTRVSTTSTKAYTDDEIRALGGYDDPMPELSEGEALVWVKKVRATEEYFDLPGEGNEPRGVSSEFRPPQGTGPTL